MSNAGELSINLVFVEISCVLLLLIFILVYRMNFICTG